MIEILFEAIVSTVEISAIVFIMMVIVDFFDVRSSGKIKKLISRTRWHEYSWASFLGATPGCMGTYINVSMYMHGFIGFGAIAAGMIASTGDEAFVMLVRFPDRALLLFGILFVIAIPLGALFDVFLKRLNIKPCESCTMHTVHKQDEQRNYYHYFTVHIWQHIFKKHVIRIVLWTFLSLLTINIALFYFPLDLLVKENMALVLLFAVLIGIIPQSGPHLIFISLYANGLIPFSVLLASSISQDGHGMLPMLSYSLRDSILVKSYNLVVALIIGWAAYAAGL